jgi:carboxyl-terminal processing protease
MTKILLTTLVLLLSSAPALAQGGGAERLPESGATATRPAAASDEKARRESFDIVWRTINDNHFDPTFGGVDWAQVRVRYEPLAMSARSDAEFYDVLRRMIGELKLSHFVIYPPGALQTDTGANDKPGQPAIRRGAAGLDLRIIDGRPVVTRVESGSAAERAGLRTGYVILKVGNRDMAEMVSRLARSEMSEAYRQAHMRGAALSALEGAAGESRRVTFLDEQDRQREATLTLLESTDEMSQPLGNFPAVPTQFESRRIGDVGYIRFNIWVASMMPKLREAVRALSDTRAIIFDLRGNPGGLGIVSMGLAGTLTDREFSLGTMTQRRGHMNFIANPQPNPYKGAVVVLIDNLSASTSEIFALGLQEAGRAVVVGEQSAGAALPSVFSRLPTGATFQYAFADFKTPKGVLVEGRGVLPDREVKLDRRSLLAGSDAQLEAALELARRRAATTPAPTR